MSAYGAERTLLSRPGMSAFERKADILKESGAPSRLGQSPIRLIVQSARSTEIIVWIE